MGHISTPDEIRFVMRAVLRNGVHDLEHRLQGFVFNDDLRRGITTGLGRLADHQRDDLAVIKHFRIREQHFIVTHRADVIHAWNVLRKQNRGDARHHPGGGRVALQNFRPRMRSANRPDLEHVAPRAKIIRIDRFPRDMFVRAFMGRIFCSSRRKEALTNSGL